MLIYDHACEYCSGLNRAVLSLMHIGISMYGMQHSAVTPSQSLRRYSSVLEWSYIYAVADGTI